VPAHTHEERYEGGWRAGVYRETDLYEEAEFPNSICHGDTMPSEGPRPHGGTGIQPARRRDQPGPLATPGAGP
jgi:hypothetical protein